MIDRSSRLAAAKTQRNAAPPTEIHVKRAGRVRRDSAVPAMIAVLDDEAARHLLHALEKHRREINRNGVPMPAVLRDLAAALSDVHFGRRDGRERAQRAAMNHSAPMTMSYTEAAATLGVSRRTLRRWRAAGRIRGIGRQLVAADIAGEA